MGRGMTGDERSRDAAVGADEAAGAVGGNLPDTRLVHDGGVTDSDVTTSEPDLPLLGRTVAVTAARPRSTAAGRR